MEGRLLKGEKMFNTYNMFQDECSGFAFSQEISPKTLSYVSVAKQILGQAVKQNVVALSYDFPFNFI